MSLVDLWKKLVQLGQKLSGTEYKNLSRLEEPLLELLCKYVEPVEAVDPALAVGILRYLLDGEDETVLVRLATNDEARNKLGFGSNYISGFAYKLDDRYLSILRSNTNAPPEFWVRFGKFMDAASIKTGRFTPVSPSFPRWLQVLMELMYSARVFPAYNQEAKFWWSATVLENILVAGELPADTLVEGILHVDNAHTYSYFQFYKHPGNFAFRDVGSYLDKHSEKVRQTFTSASADERLGILQCLDSSGHDCTHLKDLLLPLAVGSSKTLRDASAVLLMKIAPAVRADIEKLLIDGNAGERNEVVTLLWRLYGQSCADLLRQTIGTDKSERVKQTVAKLLATPFELVVDSDELVSDFAIPPVEVELGTLPLSSATKAKLAELLRQDFEDREAVYKKQLEYIEARKDILGSHFYKPVKPFVMDPNTMEAIFAFVEGEMKGGEFGQGLRSFSAGFIKTITDILQPSDFKLVHVVRLLYAFGFLTLKGFNQSIGLQGWYVAPLDAYRSRCGNSFGLREVDKCVASLPDSRPGLVAEAYINSSAWNSSFEWEEEATWPLFAEHMNIICDLLSPARSAADLGYDFWRQDRRNNCFRVLAMFPKLPDPFIALLWEIALGESKKERRQAQHALAKVTGKTERIVLALADGKQTVRASAASWLGRLGDKAATEPLKKAFLKEKNETAKGALIHALDLLGADVNEFLNRDKLLKEAQAGLSKKAPKGMEWVNLDALPAVHWLDTGKPVDADIVKWWVVQGVQQKTPVCGPLLKRYLQMCRKADANKLAKYVLALWIARDTETISPDEAYKQAVAQADSQWVTFSAHQFYIDLYKNDKQNLVNQIYKSIMTTCLNSAINEKGMLAIVSAAGDGECAKVCEQYIRKWYGMRVAQCKALVEVLATIDHPLALQILLSIANRFRTKSIKQAAEEHVQAIADRQGWTIDELADRTIPDGGFERPRDENDEPCGDRAILEIDYGPRQFQVQLNDDLEPVICAKGEEKHLKSLPEPGKNDDPELASAGKKAFSEAKKTVKAVVKLQTERLYEALCTQRTWRFDAWSDYLSQHPIVGRLCVRLVWAAFAPAEKAGFDGEFLGCFRPIEDGTLTDENDKAVTFADDVTVKLAHSSCVSEELGKAWQQHLKDYDVIPIFQQFGRPLFDLPEAKRKEEDIDDFVGHQITTFKLRGKATKLGYVRGDTEDGGWFYTYRKSFTSLAMQAVIEFTGSGLPEQDMAAAIKELYFVSLPKAGANVSHWNQAKIVLGKVPPVLLSECYNDLKQIAADGTGFDAKWQEKNYYS